MSYMKSKVSALEQELNILKARDHNLDVFNDKTNKECRVSVILKIKHYNGYKEHHLATEPRLTKLIDELLNTYSKELRDEQTQ